MTHVLPLVPVLACMAMMFGAGAIAWLTTRTPLRRVPWLARRGRYRNPSTSASSGAPHE